jgi:hypothetical protein
MLTTQDKTIINNTAESSITQHELVILVGASSEQYKSYYCQQQQYPNYQLCNVITEESSSLHATFKRIIRQLKQHNTLVLSNSLFHQQQTRISLIKKIKSELDCYVTIVWFQMENATHYLWQQELNIASFDYALNHQQQQQFGDEQSISHIKLNYYSNSPSVDQAWKPDQKREGFDQLQVVNINSVYMFHRKNIDHFNHVALFIDAHSFLSTCQLNNDNFTTVPQTLPVNSGTRWIFDSWIKLKPNMSRIIVIIDQKRLFKCMTTTTTSTLTAQMYKDISKMVRRSIATLKLSYPVYYMYQKDISVDGNNIFYNTPNCGMIAYSQYVHSLNLNECIYVTEPDITTTSKTTLSFRDCSIHDLNIGLTLVQFSKLSIIPDTNTTFEQHLYKHMLQSNCDQSVAFTRKIEMVDMNTVTVKEIERYPLLKRQKATDLYCAEKSGTNGRSMGIVLSVSLIDSFLEQNQFDSYSDIYNELETFKEYRKKNIKLMATGSPQQQQQQKQEQTKPQLNNSGNNNNNNNNNSSTSILNTKSELVDYFGLDIYQQGVQLNEQNKAFELRTKIVKDHYFKMYSKCSTGSDTTTLATVYRQESLFKDNKINKSICTCNMGKKGICSHIAASIFAYRQQCDQSISSVTTTTAITTPVSELPIKKESTATTEPIVKSSNRALPGWMTGARSENAKSKTKESVTDDKQCEKKVKTPFFLFRDDYYEQVKQELQTNKVTEISKALGERWRNLSEQDKQKYKVKYEQLKGNNQSVPVNTTTTTTTTTTAITESNDKKKKEITLDIDEEDDELLGKQQLASLEITSTYIAPVPVVDDTTTTCITNTEKSKVNYEDIFFGSTTSSTDIAPRMAPKVNVQMSTNIVTRAKTPKVEDPMDFESIFFGSGDTSNKRVVHKSTVNTETSITKPTTTSSADNPMDFESIFFGSSTKPVQKSLPPSTSATKPTTATTTTTDFESIFFGNEPVLPPSTTNNRKRKLSSDGDNVTKLEPPPKKQKEELVEQQVKNNSQPKKSSLKDLMKQMGFAMQNK